jgi:hypothetical protein
MLQILIWAACVLIVAVGFCGMYLEKLAARDKVKNSTGYAFFILMFILAGVIFAISLAQGQGVSELMKQFLP